ncbi:MAG: class I SAM-dependent methyltransferase [Rubrobacter sp.]
MSTQPQPHDKDGGNEAERFWEGHYRRHERLWSGKANAVLVDVAEPLQPGTALDLGCGEGGDAIWLAELGWRVTAVDVSATALDRAAAYAAEAGIADRIDFQRHDLAHTFPAGTFDLVSAQYLHSPVEFPRDRVLRAATRAVAPGGLLLVVGHGSVRPWAWNHDPHHSRFPTPEEVLASLDLSPGVWRTERLGSPERQATGPDGEPATVTDNVLAVERLAS